MPTLGRTGCSRKHLPRRKPVNPLGGKATGWRAGCGKPASPVRREGEPKPIGSPYPYILARLFKANGIKFSVGEREALECGGFNAAFPFLDRSRNGKAALKPRRSKGCR